MKQNLLTFSQIILLGIGAILISTQHLSAQPQNCAVRAAVVERLNTAYGETRQSVGLGKNNVMIETFASDETGTWTIIATTTEGISCLLASGRAFEQLIAKAVNDKSTAI